MLRQAIRGARWHYAAGTSSSPRAFSAVAARRLDYGGPNDKVTFYEQDAPGKKRRRIDPEAEEIQEREEVQNELSRIHEELKELEKGPFHPDSPFIQSLPEKDRQIALEALRKYDEEHGDSENGPTLDDVFDEELDDMLKKEFEGMALEEEENWQGRQKLDTRQQVKARDLDTIANHPFVAKFKKMLRRFKDEEADERTRQELWKSYRRCKQAVPGFLESITPDEAQAVWNSQASSQSSNTTRSTHLQTLVQDTTSVGRTLATLQILTFIEALHDGGSTTEALVTWEAYQSELSQKKEDLEEYWMQGVRLFAAESNPQRAQDIALAFLANDQSRQPRILIPVIIAWAKIPGEEAEVKAWTLYLQLKTFLGPDMTMEDYDQISISLLSAGRLDTAIAIFKDMMVTRQDPSKDSTAVYREVLGLAGNLQASSINEQAVNKVSLSVLTMLPRQFQNRFFFASWMKKLIGMGHVDSAALVIELMYERGVRPDAKHLNGLIAGWLREGNAESRDKAEALAWSMIQHRIKTVWQRYELTKPAPEVQVQSQKTGSRRLPPFMQREIPPAGIETFSILLLHYTRRGEDDMIKYLVKCLGDAQIQPNSYFMNHLLYAELRKQDIKALWTKFQKMSVSVRPDLETYACLWDCAKLQYDRGRPAFDSGFPSARQLFANMVQWYSQLPPHAQRITRAEFSKELFDQIVRCFCLSKDVPGTLVALYSMRAAFGFAPDDVTARLIILQVARLAGVPAGTPKHRLRRLSSTPRSKENIAQVSRLLEILGERKSMGLRAQGLGIEQLDPHEREQYQLEIIADLLRIVLSRTENLDPVQVERKITLAATEMGVDGIDLGQPIGVDDSQLL
ncbi:hypothetical protein N7468_001979 [Penicillium chermesinum]|uniref:Pentatricopeptide repeat protein n=1 Tax=Penicillium chermesinum TaxID=63820 RepID=A0A9W9TX27_9EURO|nr:uncharacterized protein N7468_001979 [Penicillium chermesinum]KAJ5246996.1 hypothetical protein N7468_001979 [Penicillium chermesinum]KAJ6145247.1 hypothetical protein N7470_009142 [Penicillium chermesinum]